MSIRMLCALIAFPIASAWSAGTPEPYLGRWVHDEERGFDYVSLEADGRCKLVGGEKEGGAFLGVFCSYTANGNNISIVETWDNSGQRQKPSNPVTFEYVVGKDTLRTHGEGTHIEFRRTTQSENEYYESWHK